MGISIFEFDNYKTYLKAWVDDQPNKGRGAYTKMAQATGVHSSSLSQIVNGDKDFNTDHMIRLAELLQLTSLEKDYLIALLMHEKAGQDKTRVYWRDKLSELKEKSRSIGERVSPQTQLNEEQKALFYSSWLYPTIHLLTSIPEYTTVPAIATKLGLKVDEVERVVQFLLATGLLVQAGANGEELKMGKASTYIPHTSPLVARHHHNWRVKSLEHHERLDPEYEISYTGPMTLSREDAARVRALAVELSEKAYNIAVPSPAEELYCLNIDWFRVL